jgi:hypothetical protein
MTPSTIEWSLDSALDWLDSRMDQFQALAVLEPATGYFHGRCEGLNEIYKRAYEYRDTAAPPLALLIKYAALYCDDHRAKAAAALTADPADVDYQLGLADGANDFARKLSGAPIEVDPDRGAPFLASL